MKYPDIQNIARNLALCLAAGVMLAACGGESENSANGPQTILLANGEACNAAWVSTKVYVAGNKVSYKGVNYTAAYWTQGDDPALKHGPQGSGQPWINGFTCGAQTTSTTSTSSSKATTTSTTNTTQAGGMTSIVATASVSNNSISVGWKSNSFTRFDTHKATWSVLVDYTGMSPALTTTILSTGCTAQQQQTGCVWHYQDVGTTVLTDAVPVGNYKVSVKACNTATPAVCVTSNEVPVTVTVAPKTLGVIHLHVDPTGISSTTTFGTNTTTSSTTVDSVPFSYRAMMVDNADPVEVSHAEQVKLSWGHEDFRPLDDSMFPSSSTYVPTTYKVLDNGLPITTRTWDSVRVKPGQHSNCIAPAGKTCHYVNRSFYYPLINSLPIGQHKLTVVACNAAQICSTSNEVIVNSK